MSINNLEKLFNSISNSTKPEFKVYLTNNLINQLNEHTNYMLYTLSRSYRLIMSANDVERECGSNIVKNLRIRIRDSDAKSAKQQNANQHIYLKSFDIVGSGTSSKKEEIKLSVKKKLSLDHVAENNFIDSLIETEAVDSNNQFNTLEVKDKKINSIQDFYDNLAIMMLSSEWYERHGAFITLGKILSSTTEMKSIEKANLDFNTIKRNSLIILRNDKFVDFKDEVVKAPVREEAAKLICMFSITGEEYEMIDKLLLSSDWREQISGLLTIKQFQQTKVLRISVEIQTKLIQILQETKEDDVRMIVSEILKETPLDESNIKNVILICFNCFKEFSVRDFDIYKISSFLSLLSNYLHKCREKDISIEEIVDEFKESDTLIDIIAMFLANTTFYQTIGLDLTKELLYNKSIYKNMMSLTFLLGEYILFYGSKTAINIIKELPDSMIDSSFITHFSKICEKPLSQPYDTSEFILQDEHFFDDSGLKILDPSIILNNRYLLIFQVLKKPTFSISSLLTDTIVNLLNALNDVPQRSNVYIDKNIIKADCSKYQELKTIPIRELVNFINNPFYQSFTPGCREKALEYIRFCVSRNIHISFDFTSYFLMEVCDEVLSVMFQLKLKYMKTEVDESIISKAVNKMIKYADKPEISNLVAFFKYLGPTRFENAKCFHSVLENPDRIKFFAHTADIYIKLPFFVSVFNTSLASLFKKISHYDLMLVKKAIIISESFSFSFVKESLENIERERKVPEVVNLLIEEIRPYLLIMYLKVFLKYGRHLLSYLIAGMCLKVDSMLETRNKELFDMLNNAKKEAERILNPALIKDFKVTETCKLSLRGYQRDGIKWINFLFEKGLGGILADDMGLGKTVQVLSYLITRIRNDGISLPSLIVCTSMLREHWKKECEIHFDFNNVQIFDPKTFLKTEPSLIIICTYDNVRRYFEFLSPNKYFLAVFDEGHILRNNTTVLYRRIQSLNSVNSLILTGTPVQNNVEDIYSLMDIVMPSYLGDVTTFRQHYGLKVSDKNISSFIKGSNVKYIDLVNEKTKQLQKKILPFVMRRLKTDVLDDLPPKIIKDVTIDMTSSQAKLYDSFLNIHEKDEQPLTLKGNIGYDHLKNNPLKTLRMLLKVTSHPMYFDIDEESPKSRAVVEILEMSEGSKSIIFFQNKATISYFIKDLVKRRPEITYLRLDSDVKERYSVVESFNNGSIDCLLSTCSIGGLGLNLTSANIVIFYEHDWNPFNDLQAMDRAHRLGQKRSVSVFRLITRNSIEEKVMNYQHFKMFVANNLVTQQNTKVEKMEMHNLLDKF